MTDPHIHPPGQSAGLLLTAIGFGGWVYSAVLKLFAQATVPGTNLSWPDLGQAISGLTVLAGVVLAWYLSSRDKIHQADLKKARDDADFAREQSRLNADAARERRIHDALAEIQVSSAKLSQHLERQDVAIQALAVGATPVMAVATREETGLSGDGK